VAGLTQVQLAEMAGTTQQTINRLELGEVRDSSALEAIGRALNWPSLTESDGLPQATQPPSSSEEFVTSDALRRVLKVELSWLPVFSQGAPPSFLIDSEPVDEIRCPEPLIGVRGAYAIYLAENEMHPALHAGDLLLIHPHLPPRSGNEVLYRSADDRSLVRTLVDIHPDRHTVRCWLSSIDTELDFADWPVRHVVVGKFSRV
jgi:SOS-response transcriptional repressor LexA